MFGVGKALDPNKHFIVCANVLGSCYGSSGPLSNHLIERGIGYHLFPEFTIRDVVAAHEILRAHLHIDCISGLIGASLGGQQAIEWSISHPLRIKNLILLATNAFHSAFGIACNESQRMAIEADFSWQAHHASGGLKGLRAARSMALLTYRSYGSYEEFQSEDSVNKRKGFKASSYQNYQGDKLARRFNAFSYYRLTQAMDSHHVGRSRGGVVSALSMVQANTLIISVDGDILFPQSEQILLHKYIKKSNFKKVYSRYGHDGFLKETNQINPIIHAFLATKKRKNQINNHA